MQLNSKKNNQISENSHLIANFLAKFSDSYSLLEIGNQTETHNYLGEVLNIKPSSFKRLRDEYDGFYKNRNGYPDVINRTSRVKFKKTFDRLNKSIYLNKIKNILDSLDPINKALSEKRVARLAFNTNGWIYPSGNYGKSTNKDSHEANFGYGHEEWLFDTSKIIDGYHYGFLEPIRKQQKAYQDNLFNVWLYTIDAASKSRYCVGEIVDLEVINPKKANSIKSIYNKNGWLDEMENQIVDAGANKSGFSDWNGVDLFNIRFKPNNLIVNDPYIELLKDNPIYKLSRYNFSHFNETYEVALADERQKSFIFIPDEYRQSDINDNIVTTKHKRESKSIEITYLHKSISKRLTNVLKDKYGNKRVKSEHPSGIGLNKIDIVVDSSTDGLIFYEIKTYNSVKSSIREAIGQLLEYSLWPNVDNAKQFIVITQKHNDLDDVKLYFHNLRRKLGIQIYYQWFDIENNELSEKF